MSKKRVARQPCDLDRVQNAVIRADAVNFLLGELWYGDLGYLNMLDATREQRNLLAHLEGICYDVLKEELSTAKAVIEQLQLAKKVAA